MVEETKQTRWQRLRAGPKPGETSVPDRIFDLLENVELVLLLAFVAAIVPLAIWAAATGKFEFGGF